MESGIGFVSMRKRHKCKRHKCYEKRLHVKSSLGKTQKAIEKDHGRLQTTFRGLFYGRIDLANVRG